MNNSLKKLLLGDGFGAFSTWIDFITILTIATYQFQVNPYQMALVSAAGLLPAALLNKRIGSLIDKSQAIVLLRVSLVLRITMTLGIMLSANFSLFIILITARGIFSSVLVPAINVLSVRSLANTNATDYYSILNIINNAAKILAPAIGALIATWYSANYAFILSIILSFIALVIFWFVDEPPKISASGESGQNINIDNNLPKQQLYLFLLCVTVYFTFVFMLNNQLPLMLNVMKFNQETLGLLISCSGVGNILSGILTASLSKKHPIKGTINELLLPGFFTAIGFTIVGLSLFAPTKLALLSIMIIFFIIGIFSARFAITMNVFMANNFSQQIGLISARVQALQNIAILVGPIVGAYILSKYQPPVLFFIASGIGICSFSVIYFRKYIKINYP